MIAHNRPMNRGGDEGEFDHRRAVCPRLRPGRGASPPSGASSNHGYASVCSRPQAASRSSAMRRRSARRRSARTPVAARCRRRVEVHVGLGRAGLVQGPGAGVGRGAEGHGVDDDALRLHGLAHVEHAVVEDAVRGGLVGGAEPALAQASVRRVIGARPRGLELVAPVGRAGRVLIAAGNSGVVVRAAPAPLER